MKPHRAGLLLASGSALALLLAACGGSSNSASPQPTSTGSQVFTYDTTATVMDDGWDPATEYSDGIIAMNNMYETLTRYNAATHKVDPLLATSWSKSANGLTWTFHLRHGVHFHTGRLMTAPEAKAALQRTIKLGGGAAYVFEAVKTITAPDQYTLVFHLKFPSPMDLAASAAYSAYIYDTQAAGSGASRRCARRWWPARHPTARRCRLPSPRPNRSPHQLGRRPPRPPRWRPAGPRRPRRLLRQRGPRPRRWRRARPRRSRPLLRRRGPRLPRRRRPRRQ